jgi:hypothetical protein
MTTRFGFETLRFTACPIIPARPDHRDTARVRLVVDALVALFDRERGLLAGTS